MAAAASREERSLKWCIPTGSPSTWSGTVVASAVTRRQLTGVLPDDASLGARRLATTSRRLTTPSSALLPASTGTVETPSLLDIPP